MRRAADDGADQRWDDEDHDLDDGDYDQLLPRRRDKLVMAHFGLVRALAEEIYQSGGTLSDIDQRQLIISTADHMLQHQRAQAAARARIEQLEREEEEERQLRVLELDMATDVRQLQLQLQQFEERLQHLMVDSLEEEEQPVRKRGADE